ncbi:DUF2834 domain-containing protein [Nonomuraea angiospora]|uniref:DUF2834 domain-containing protein n=1 Tax=Nonomuraea angiospora TaxID=46172 RepID=UPI003319EB36
MAGSAGTIPRRQCSDAAPLLLHQDPVLVGDSQTEGHGRAAGQDYTIGNLILLPLMTIIDGRRRGVVRTWLFFVSGLFTSFAFAWAFYLATTQRQRRLTGSPPHTHRKT